MSRLKVLIGCLSLVLVSAAAWLGNLSRAEPRPEQTWKTVAPGILRSPGYPAGYALVSGESAILIDAPRPLAEVKAQGIKTITAVHLTHHHRDSCAFVGEYLKEKIPVRAAELSAPLLKPEGVEKYWRESLPLRSSRTAYLVVPEGFADIDCTMKDGQAEKTGDWSIEVISSPGHTTDHLAFLARKNNKGPGYLFCGDALASSGKLWTPYTTDWDHWTNAGLKPAAESLRKLARREPDMLLPAHGEVISKDCKAVLTTTAEAVEEMSFLKSFERFTKQRLGKAPEYRFLAKEQAESNGSKPWSRVSEHIWLTGNTYVLVSKDNAILVFDPWDPHSAKQIPKLKAEQKLGDMEVVLFSHAHYDHYDGIYSIFEREKPRVWTLDQVAIPLADPFKLRAPFLDVRPIKFDRLFKDGETATWREYTFKFHFLPGQTEFTMGVEATIDGKRCYFTADNWFHQDQFSGTGGWMGLNRSHPLLYAASAQKVLDAKPEWVLAEHGGAFEFNAEDFRRRVEWGKVGAKAANSLCVSGNLLHDWNPHRVRFEPVLVKAKPGATLNASLIVSNPLREKRKLTVTMEGRGVVRDQTWEIELDGNEVRKDVNVKLPEKLTAGRHVFTLRAMEGDRIDGSDAFLAVDIAE
jgi:glyoxylase-like metal-dependent hydrolase (beta-lactamase superfamily II)